MPMRGGEDVVLPEHGLTCRGPAKCGDITLAVDQGFLTIGLVDGRFEDVAAVWHKEILYALSKGVTVYGAASMGALRAAECYSFGMIGIGDVFERYAFNGLEDDAAVAQVHAPAEFGYIAFSEAMVTVDATLEKATEAGVIDFDELHYIRAVANAIFFKERSWRRIFEEVSTKIAHAEARIKPHICNIKRHDATLLLEAMLGHYEPVRTINQGVYVPHWSFNETSQWLKLKI